MSVLYEVFAGGDTSPKFFVSLHLAKVEAREQAQLYGRDVGVNVLHYGSLTKTLLLAVLNGDGWVEDREDDIYIAKPRRGSRVVAASE